MLIWLALLIPLLTAVVLAVFFHHRTKWWEFGIPFVVSLALVGIFKVGSEYSATRDSEFWNGWVLSSHYYEDWNEYIHRTCYRQSCSGSGNSRSCVSVPYDCSYVAYHPEYWSVKDSNGEEVEVDKSWYHHFTKLFLPLGGRPTFVDMRRHYHTDDGDMYQVLWPKTAETVTPVNTKHSYENRVQASRSVFNYRKIAEEEAKSLGLFDYPKISYFDYPAVLGNCGTATEIANNRLRYHNAVLGKAKELRMWLLCTDSADPAFGQLQESYWIGGNKNEVVVILGKGWSHVFSWTDSKEPLIEVRNFTSQDQDPVRVVDAMAYYLEEGFVRKHFEDFSYLTVETPTWAIILTFLVTLFTNIGLSYFIIHNEWYEEWHKSHPTSERTTHAPLAYPRVPVGPLRTQRLERKLRAKRHHD